jgi:AraC-like DNA-binding protein
MLRTNVQWRKYSIDTIADECGFSTRPKFSTFFIELTALMPSEYIQKINDESGDS